jgi:hypothetical protein
MDILCICLNSSGPTCVGPLFVSDNSNDYTR